jgi:DNA replication protein DnaC
METESRELVSNLLMSDPDSDTVAIELAKVLDQRRAALGIDEPCDAPRVISRIPPAVTQERQAEIDARRASEESSNRDGRRMETWNALLTAAGYRYAQCKLETFQTPRSDQQRVVEALLDYTANIQDRRDTGTGVVLYGPCGTGKDHLAFGIARAAVAAYMSVVWLNGQDWYGKIRDAMDDETPEASLINRIARPDFAFISDPLPPIGNLSQHQATMLYRAIEARYAARRPTVVTVNVATDDEADSRLGVPTWDRICDGAWKVRCSWPSYRKPAKEIK